MPEPLSETEVRVLGSLVEKQLTTPEYYPLTLHALAAACSQRSNRDPVVNFDEATIMSAIDGLRDKNLVYLFYGSGSRTVKYKHMLPSVYELEPEETALIAVLLLRGPQTIGELRERTSRLHEFGGLGEVQEALDRLTARNEPLIAKLERQPGQKDARYAHLLGGPTNAAAITVGRKAVEPAAPQNGRLEKLEAEVANLSSELAAVREEFAAFRKQFD